MQLDFVYRSKRFGQSWSQSTLDRISRPHTTNWTDVKNEHLASGWEIKAKRRVWPAWAWPGGYPVFYITADSGVLCPACANKHLPRTFDKDDGQFYIVQQLINYEDPHLHCDHCNGRIPSAYAGDGEEE